MRDGGGGGLLSTHEVCSDADSGSGDVILRRCLASINVSVFKAMDMTGGLLLLSESNGGGGGAKGGGGGGGGVGITDSVACSLLFRPLLVSALGEKLI